MYAPARTCTRIPVIEQVPVSAAAEALAGLAFAAAGKPFAGRFVEVPEAAPGALGRVVGRVVGAERRAAWLAADRAAADVATSGLVAVAVLRQVRAVRRVVRRRLPRAT